MWQLVTSGAGRAADLVGLAFGNQTAKCSAEEAEVLVDLTDVRGLLHLLHSVEQNQTKNAGSLAALS